MSTKTCSFVFDPDEWDKDHALCDLSKNILTNGVWECPHDRYDTTDYCLFHQPLDNSIENHAELCLTYLNETGSNADEPRRFIGAKFHSLSLSHRVIDNKSTLEVDLRYSTFTRELNLDYASIRSEINLNGSFIRKFSAHGSSFEHRLNMKYCQIGSLDLTSAQFKDRVDLSNITVGETTLYNVKFLERALFEECKFSQYVVGERATFTSSVTFDGATFREGAEFPQAKFKSEFIFSDVILGDRISFSGSDFEKPVDISVGTTQSDAIELDLSQCTVLTGKICVQSELLTTDFSEATIGTVSLYDRGAISLKPYTFYRTEFDGFNFSEYSNELLSNHWLIHQMESSSSSRFSHLPLIKSIAVWQKLNSDRGRGESIDIDIGALRETYLMAKNGAKQVGDNTATAEFFSHEMRYKRIGHLEHWLSDRSFLALYRWVANWGYNLTSGYGERPSRTILSSFCIVLSFTPIYSVYTDLSLVTSLGFSFQSFVSLILGPPPEAKVADQIAAFEAFLGAFMIALFVFTLTRSIRR